MEIEARPRSRFWGRLSLVLASLAVLLAVGLLTPAALGLQQQLVTDDALRGSVMRGALAFQSSVDDAGQVDVGDVVVFLPPGSPADASPVTRRVLRVDGHDLHTGDDRGAADPWTVQIHQTDVQRIVLAVPFAGYPQLVAPVLTWPLLTLLLAVGAALAARKERRRSAGRRPLTQPGSHTAAADAHADDAVAPPAVVARP